MATTINKPKQMIDKIKLYSEWIALNTGFKCEEMQLTVDEKGKVSVSETTDSGTLSPLQRGIHVLNKKDGNFNLRVSVDLFFFVSSPDIGEQLAATVHAATVATPKQRGYSTATITNVDSQHIADALHAVRISIDVSIYTAIQVLQYPKIVQS